MPAVDDDLAPAVASVLDGNWAGTHTRPAPGGLYPHQWSWDSAFVAIGLRHLSPRRAQLELESLFTAQWDDGRLPQIVFDVGRDDDYSPGPGFWRSEEIGGSPSVPTSGFVQPPMHAWAALAVHRADPAESTRHGFLQRAYPALVAWHEYLRARRTRGPGSLACLVHPWESGMDNSPSWDAPLAAVGSADLATSTPRPDLQHTAAAERPTSQEYAAYLGLTARYRDHTCDDVDDGHPFLVEDPGINTLWAVAEQALAVIAETVGRPSTPHLERAAEIAAGLDALWDERVGTYVARDLRTGELQHRATSAGLLPLLAPDLPHHDDLLATLRGPRFTLGHVQLVPSYDLTAPDLDTARYWRGPSWINVAWLLIQSLRAHGERVEADALVEQVRCLAVAGDFPEYVDPYTGAPHGARSFSWTAALALDLTVDTTSVVP